MFNFRLVEGSQDSDADYPEPLVVSFPHLDEDSLRALPIYLVQTLPARLELRGIRTHLGARPIAFEIGGDVLISERAIWSMLLDMPSAAEYVAIFVEAVLSMLPDDEKLWFYSHMDVLGQEPLCAYFDRFLRRRKWMNVNEDHERLAKFLYFRLSTGQAIEPRLEYAGFLARNGTLRRIVDRLLQDASGRGGLMADDLRELGAARDIELAKFAGNLDTGFHDNRAKIVQWEWVVGRDA